MGLHIGYSRCRHDTEPATTTTWYNGSAPSAPSEPLPNPNPCNFRVLQTEQVGPWCIAKVFYPDCRNYEGQKVLLYRAPANVVEGQQRLDPHFCDNPECLSPFARFEPTELGWNAAIILAQTLLKREDEFVQGLTTKTRWARLLEDE